MTEPLTHEAALRDECERVGGTMSVREEQTGVTVVVDAGERHFSAKRLWKEDAMRAVCFHVKEWK